MENSSQCGCCQSALQIYIYKYVQDMTLSVLAAMSVSRSARGPADDPAHRGAGHGAGGDQRGGLPLGHEGHFQDQHGELGIGHAPG